MGKSSEGNSNHSGTPAIVALLVAVAVAVAFAPLPNAAAVEVHVDIGNWNVDDDVSMQNMLVATVSCLVDSSARATVDVEASTVWDSVIVTVEAFHKSGTSVWKQSNVGSATGSGGSVVKPSLLLDSTAEISLIHTHINATSATESKLLDGVSIFYESCTYPATTSRVTCGTPSPDVNWSLNFYVPSCNWTAINEVRQDSGVNMATDSTFLDAITGIGPVEDGLPVPGLGCSIGVPLPGIDSDGDLQPDTVDEDDDCDGPMISRPRPEQVV